MLQAWDATHLIVQLGVDSQVEIIINLSYLGEVLLLHFTPCLTLTAVLLRIWEQDLVDDNVVDIDLLLGELNCKSFRLVHTQELWNAHCNECCLVCILELLVNLLYLSLHAIYAIKQSLLHIFGVAALLLHHRLHLIHHATKLIFELYQLQKTLFEDIWEV